MYADLVERCQTALYDGQETLKTTQAALEDGQSALSAVDSLSDRANALLFRDDVTFTSENAVSGSSSLDWQRTCLNDFLSIELSTVRELVERSRKWLTSLQSPDGQLAELISSGTADDVAKIEERITRRLEALEEFSRGLVEIAKRISVEEIWQREAQCAPQKDQPNTLTEKQEFFRSIEVCFSDFMTRLTM